MSQDKGSVSASLAKFQIAELASLKNELVTASTTDSVSDAMQVCEFKGISCLPVRDGSAGDITGLLNLVDIVTFVAYGVFPHGSDPATVNVDEALPKLVTTKCSDLVGVTDESKRVWAFEDTQTLGELLEPLARGVHRCVVHSRSGPSKIVSQTDVVRLLNKHRDLLKGDVLAKKLSETGALKPTAEGRVVSTPATASTLDAFRHMGQLQLSAVAVVDAQSGALVGNLSASDMRGVNATAIPASMRQPVGEFLAGRQGGQMTHPVTATPDDTLGDVIQRMVTAGVKHCWVVDSAQKPLFCFSNSDVIDVLTAPAL